MSYPYGEIKQIYDKAKRRGYRLSGMSKDMLKLFKFKEQDIPYRDVPIENFGRRVVFGSDKAQKDKNRLMNDAVNHLATLYMAKSADFIYRERFHFLRDADPALKEQTALEYMFTHFFVSREGTHWKDGELAYRATQREYDVMGKSTGVILPDLTDNDYADIVRMAKSLAATINVHPMFLSDPNNAFLYKIKDIEETGVVRNMCIDYVTWDTLYLVRCGRTYTRDIIHLLMCYILMKKSPKYRVIPVKHLCMVGTAYGQRRYVDIDNVDPIVLTIIHCCLFGTGDGWPAPAMD